MKKAPGKTAVILYLACLALLALALGAFSFHEGVNPLRLISRMYSAKLGNLLDNGNFSRGLVGWQPDAGNDESLRPDRGGGLLMGRGNGGKCGLSQYFYASAGHTYTLRLECSPCPGSLSARIFPPDERDDYKVLSEEIADIIRKDKDALARIKVRKETEAGTYSTKFTAEKTAFHQLSLDYAGKEALKIADVQIRDVEGRSKLLLLLLAGLLALLLLWGCLLMPLDRAFALVLAVLFLLPAIKFDNVPVSLDENRTLARFPSPFSDGRYNRNFCPDFSLWVNDHFFLRYVAMHNQTLLQSFLNGRHDKGEARSGREGWYFTHIGSLVRTISGAGDEKSLARTALALRNLGDFCRASGADLLVLVAPYPEEVYSDMLLGLDISRQAGKLGPVLEKLSRETGVNIQYAFDSLREARKDGLVCYKTDHHWTKLGAYYGYRQIMDSLGLPSEKLENYRRPPESMPIAWGNVYKALNLPPDKVKETYPLETRYEFLVKNRKAYRYVNTNPNDLQVVNPRGNGRSLLLFGDSYSIALRPYFSDSFSRFRSWYQPGAISWNNIRQIITEYQPDIVVAMVFALNYNNIQGWLPEKP